MGAHVDFFAFREAPDPEKLSSIRGLDAFRLFKHRARAEWYLEDFGTQRQISFNGPLKYTPQGESAKRAEASAKDFYNAIKQARLESWGIANKPIVQGLALSLTLGISTLAVYGNSASGVDVGLICEAGEVQFAKLSGLPTGVLVYEAGIAKLEQPSAEDLDEDGEPILDLFQFATEVANRFFSEDKRWRVSPDGNDASEYALLLERQRKRSIFGG